MIGTRLRTAPTPGELAAMYPTPHDHRHYGAGHDLRVRVSIAVGQWLAGVGARVADLSCGDGTIAQACTANPILGDLAPGWPICGPVEATIDDLAPVDVYVCTETLEHLADPADLLAVVRAKAHRLLVSFPHCDEPDINTEHIWQWTPDEARTLLAAAGWEAETWATLAVPDGPYTYSIVGCR